MDCEEEQRHRHKEVEFDEHQSAVPKLPLFVVEQFAGKGDAGPVNDGHQDDEDRRDEQVQCKVHGAAALRRMPIPRKVAMLALEAPGG